MTTPPKPDVERGTAIDRRTVFGDWDENFWVNDPAKPTDVQLDRMFERDGKARLLEQSLTLPMRQAKLRITPPKNDRGQLALVTDALTRPANAGGMSTPFWQVLGQATSALSHRRAFFEKVWNTDGGTWTYDKLAFRPANSCRVKRDKVGAFQGFVQYVGSEHPGADNLGEITIAPENAWVYFHGAHRDPLHGISDFDVAFNNHVVKQKIRYIYFALYLENSALPKTTVSPPAQGSSEDPKALAKTVAGLRNGGVAGLPAGATLSHFPVGQGQPFLDALTYLDADTAASILAGFSNLTDPGKSGGSFALSKDATDFFLMSQTAKLVELGGSITSWVAADLVRWNHGPDAEVPEVGFEPLVREDVTPALEALTGLAAQPSIPSGFIDLLIEEVGKRMGFPVDKVAQAIAARQEQAPPTEAGQVGAAVGAVAPLVAQAQSQ